MRMFFHTRIKAFKFALEGWWYVIRTQRNAWVHAIFTFLSIFLGVWLQISLGDWAIIILAVALVWMAEFLNTALEAVVDLASEQLVDVDPVAAGVQGVALLGAPPRFAMQVLGDTLFVRTTDSLHDVRGGVERVDLTRLPSTGSASAAPSLLELRGAPSDRKGRGAVGSSSGGSGILRVRDDLAAKGASRELARTTRIAGDLVEAA